jgi:putative addiction module killer protein
MPVEMVLNDLSLPSSINERGVARKLMSDLISVLSTAAISGVKTLRTQDNLYNLMLSSNYPIASWLKDNQVEREERSFLLALVTKTPLLAEITDPAVKDKGNLADFKCQDQSAYALGIAYLLNALAVSFYFEPKWDCDKLDLEIIQLENSTSGTSELKLTTINEVLIHASRKEHVLSHKAQIQHRLRVEPWHTQDELLPCFVTANGKNSLAKWLDSLGDRLAQEIIQSRLNNVKQGNLGDHSSVGDGVWELRIFYGPGYRIYFGKVTTDKQLLLWGGDKSTQVQDIIQAKQHWQDHERRQSISG